MHLQVENTLDKSTRPSLRGIQGCFMIELTSRRPQYYASFEQTNADLTHTLAESEQQIMTNVNVELWTHYHIYFSHTQNGTSYISQ